jgi:hypothetical protein
VVSREERFAMHFARFSATDHPVRAFQRRLRGIFLMARPPLLFRGFCKTGRKAVLSAVAAVYDRRYFVDSAKDRRS